MSFTKKLGHLLPYSTAYVLILNRVLVSYLLVHVTFHNLQILTLQLNVEEDVQ